MAILTLTVDTAANTMEAAVDGVPVLDPSSVSAWCYRCYGEDPEAHFCVDSGRREAGVTHRNSISAAFAEPKAAAFLATLSKGGR